MVEERTAATAKAGEARGSGASAVRNGIAWAVGGLFVLFVVGIVLYAWQSYRWRVAHALVNTEIVLPVGEAVSILFEVAHPGVEHRIELIPHPEDDPADYRVVVAVVDGTGATVTSTVWELRAHRRVEEINDRMTEYWEHDDGELRFTPETAGTYGLALISETEALQGGRLWVIDPKK